MKIAIEKHSQSLRLIITGFLIFIFFVTSLGLGLGLGLNGNSASRQSINSPAANAITPEELGLGSESPWPLAFSMVAAGGSHSLAITTSGDLYSWGDNTYGQLGLGNTTAYTTPQPVMSGTKFTAAAARSSHSLAITASGDLYSFGSNDYGQLGIGTSGEGTEKTTPQLVMSGTKFSSIGTGALHSLAITTSGDLYSWGYNSVGQLGLDNTIDQSNPQLVMSGTKFMSVSCGGSHSLAVTTSYNLYSFGSNDFGQLGQGTVDWDAHPTPQIVMSGTLFITAAAGFQHSLARSYASELFTFGKNDYGQLGQGTADWGAHPTPQIVMSGTTFSSISAGDSHSLARTTGSSLYSFGRNNYGQLGLGTLSNEYTPQLVMNGTSFTSIAAGYYHSFAFTSAGDLYTFGRNNCGQLGLGNTDEKYTPQLISKRPLPPWSFEFEKISAGDSHTLAITTSGDLYSWGKNTDGQLGLGTSGGSEYSFSLGIDQTSPQVVMSGTKFQSIAAGSGHSLAITTSGDLYSWGGNYLGELGLGHTNNQSSPQLVMSGTKFSFIEADYRNSFAITTTGDLYAWGYNGSGKLGLNAGTMQYESPQIVMSGTKFTCVATSESNSLALTIDGNLYSFGWNYFGQLGLGTTGSGTSTPQLVMSGTKFQSIATGYCNSFAITTAGVLYSWGYNYYGELGLGISGGLSYEFTSGIDQSTPQVVMSGTTFSNISVGYYHSLALTTTGELVSFGNNSYGQLGLGNNTQQSTPQVVMSGTIFSNISAGYSHSLALAADGNLYTFGRNNLGQLGIGSIVNEYSPQLIAGVVVFNICTSFSSNSSVLSRMRIGEQYFITESNLKIDNGGEVSIFFQTLSQITQIIIDVGADSIVFTSAQFNGVREIGGVSFVLTSINNKQVFLQVSNTTSDVTIAVTTENNWLVECIDEYSGSTFVDVSSSYSVLSNPASIPTGKTFAGWWTRPGVGDDWGERVTSTTAFSNITNWDSVERIDRVYARWN